VSVPAAPPPDYKKLEEKYHVLKVPCLHVVHHSLLFYLLQQSIASYSVPFPFASPSHFPFIPLHLSLSFFRPLLRNIMSWQTYVDTNLVGTGHIKQGAIIGHNGSVWATTPGFNVSTSPAYIYIYISITHARLCIIIPAFVENGCACGDRDGRVDADGWLVVLKHEY
jgi:hypothetical protein